MLLLSQMSSFSSSTTDHSCSLWLTRAPILMALSSSCEFSFLLFLYPILMFFCSCPTVQPSLLLIWMGKFYWMDYLIFDSQPEYAVRVAVDLSMLVSVLKALCAKAYDFTLAVEFTWIHYCSWVCLSISLQLTCERSNCTHIQWN